MANLKFVAQTTEQGLSAGVGKTMLVVTAPANQRVKVLGWGVYFDGVNTTILATAADTTTKPAVQCQLSSGSSAGAQTDTLGAPDSHGSKTPLDTSLSIQSVAKTTTTAEPTALAVYDIAEVNPASGGYEVMFTEENMPVVAGGDYVAIFCNAPDAVNCRVKLFCEE